LDSGAYLVVTGYKGFVETNESNDLIAAAEPQVERLGEGLLRPMLGPLHVAPAGEKIELKKINTSFSLSFCLSIILPYPLSLLCPSVCLSLSLIILTLCLSLSL
jgi:hypothetical protein